MTRRCDDKLLAAAPKRCSSGSRRCCRRRRRAPDWKRVDRVPLAQAQRRAAYRAGRARAPHRACATCRASTSRSGWSSRTRASSSTGLPANNVLLTGARGTGKSSLIKALLNKYAAQGPAPDRSREAGPRRPARHRRPDRRARRSASSSSATTCRSRPTSRLQGAQGGARRLDRGGVRELPDLRDLQPAPPDAGVHAGEPRDQARRRGDPSGRDRRRRRSRFRSASACGSRSIRSTRTSTWRSSTCWLEHFGVPGAGTRSRAQGGAAVGAHARLAQRPRRLAVRARLGGQAADAGTKRASEADVSAHASRSRRCGPAARRRQLPARAAPRGQGLRGLLGISRRQGRARRVAPRRRSRASCTKSSASTCSAPIRGSRATTTTSTPRCGCASSA